MNACIPEFNQSGNEMQGNLAREQKENICHGFEHFSRPITRFVGRRA